MSKLAITSGGASNSIAMTTQQQFKILQPAAANTSADVDVNR
jgi:hypothetical protein